MSEDDSVKHEGKWTRRDLPSGGKIRDADDMAGNGLRSRVIDIALNEVVAHLNTHHPKPEPDKWRAEWVAVSEDLKAARRQSDLAHEQWQKWEAQAGRAESGRNAAVASAEQLDKNLAKAMSDYQDVEDECDELMKHLKVTEVVRDIERKQHEETSDNLVQANQRWLAAIVERDEWKARADQLRDERDDAVQSCMAVGRERDAAIARAERAEQGAWRIKFQQAVASLLDAERARDEWKARAEKAEADRENIAEEFADFRAEVVAEAVKHRESHPHESNADPVVYAVRESDIAAVEVAHDERGWHARGATWSREPTAEGVRDGAKRYLRDVAQYEALARAIEAEQAVDPVEEKARELYGVANAGVTWESVVKSANEGNRVDRQVVREYRAIARHLLGQESSDE